MLVLIDSAFGTAVASRIPTSKTVALDSFVRKPLDFPIDCGFLAVALSAKRVDLLEALDDHCRRQGLSWALSFLADKYLYCGPNFVQSARPCFRCFYRRDLTHLTSPREAPRELAIDQYFARNRQESIPGFTSGSALMSAAFIRRCSQGELPSGCLRRVQLLTGSVDDTLVFGIHDCPYCSGKTAQQKLDQTHEFLVRALPKQLQ